MVDLETLRQVLRRPSKLIAGAVAFVLAVKGLVDTVESLYQVNPLATELLLLLSLVAVGLLIGLGIVEIVARPFLWKKSGLIGFRFLWGGPKDFKPYARHDLFVNKAGDLLSKMTQLIVNLRRTRHIEISSIFHSDKPLPDELPFKTNAVKKKFVPLRKKNLVRADMTSPEKIRRFARFVLWIDWSHKGVYHADELNWYNLPAVKYEVEHDVLLSTDGLPIAWYLGDEMSDASILDRPIAEVEKYVERRVQANHRLSQPEKLNDTSLYWKISAPRSDRTYVLFFRYSQHE